MRLRKNTLTKVQSVINYVLLFTLWITFFISTLLAQEINQIKTDKVTLDLFSLPYMHLGSQASAFIIHDVGNFDIHYTPNDGQIISTLQRATRIRIINQDGVEYGTFNIPLELTGDMRYKVSKISGATYWLENGSLKKYKLEAKNILEKAESKLTVLKIKFPRVEPGCIIDLNYTLVGDFLPQPIRWQFQHEIPILLSQFSYAYPEYIKAEETQKGYIAIKKVIDKVDHLNPVNVTPTDGYGTKLTTSSHIFIPQEFNKLYLKGYQAVNVPPYKDAPHLPPEKNQPAIFLSKMTPQTAIIYPK